MKMLHVADAFEILGVNADIRNNAQREGVKVVWCDESREEALNVADVVAGYDSAGLCVDAETELGELFIELVLSRHVTKVAS